METELHFLTIPQLYQDIREKSYPQMLPTQKYFENMVNNNKIPYLLGEIQQCKNIAAWFVSCRDQKRASNGINHHEDCQSPKISLLTICIVLISVHRHTYCTYTQNRYLLIHYLYWMLQNLQISTMKERSASKEHQISDTIYDMIYIICKYYLQPLGGGGGVTEIDLRKCTL